MIYLNQNSIPFGRGCFLYFSKGVDFNSLLPFLYISSMKKILLLPLIFIFSSLNGQVRFDTETYVDDSKNKRISGTYEGIVGYVVLEADGTAKELYDKTISWINESYNSPEDVIKGQIDGEYIRFTGATGPLKFYKALGMMLGFTDSRYVIETRFKDGRVRFEPVKLEVYQQPNPAAYIKGGWIDAAFSGRIKDIKGKDDEAGIKTFNSISNYFNNLANFYQGYLVDGNSKSSNDDW